MPAQEPRKITSKFSSKCGCGQPYAVGDQILWVPGAPRGKSIAGCPSCKPNLRPAKKNTAVDSEDVSNVELTVQLQRIRVQKDNGWGIAQAVLDCPPPSDCPITDRDTQFGLLGVLGTPSSDGDGINPAKVGDVLKVVGNWERDDEWGIQFRTRGPAIPVVAADEEGMVAFLTIFRGIGEKRARDIMRKVGGLDAVTHALENDPQKLAAVSGISPDLADAIADEYKEKKGAADALAFCKEIGLGNGLQKRAIVEFGAELRQFVHQDPYVLMELRGVGFVKADKIAREKLRPPIKKDDPRRCAAAALFALDIVEDKGHTWTTKPEIVGRASSRLSRDILRKTELQSEDLERGFDILVEPRQVTRKNRTWTEEPRVHVEKVGDIERVYRASTFHAECALAGHLLRIASAEVPELSVPEGVWGELTPDEAQHDAVVEAAKRALEVVTGGPGVGKTASILTILRVLRAAGLSVKIACPTGKAAQRVKEQIGEEFADIQPQTIHRLLAYGPLNPGSAKVVMGFTKNERNTIDAGVVIIDETSMVDVPLAASLVEAVATGTRLIFVGDVDQLPSIGVGRVLHDIIESGVAATSRLTKIFRQAEESAIPYVARDINEGFRPEIPEGAKDVAHLETVRYERTGRRDDDSSYREAEKVADRVVEVVTRAKRYEPSQIQVLAPQKSGPCGVIELNTRLQNELNGENRDHDELYIGGTYSARLNDRVIHTANNYDLWVFNGETGYVVAQNIRGLPASELTNIQIPNPSLSKTEREDALDKFVEADPQALVKAKKVLVVDFGDRRVAYDRTEVRELHLAYCITIHKSQGSQFPAVVMPVHRSHHYMLARSLVYTGLTRASEFVCTIGHMDSIEAAAKNTRGSDRRTSLLERLRGGLADREEEHAS